MSHPQSSARGYIAAGKISFGDVEMSDGGTDMEISTGIDLNDGARYIRANSTGYIFEAEAAVPTTDNGVAITLLSNSTGVALLINSTGTTWKYLLTTSVQPT